MPMSKFSRDTPPEEGGLVLGWSKDMRQIYYNAEDTHSVIIGSTRSGKTRCQVLPSIGLMALAGESMVLTDPKAEQYLYTSPFLRRMDYEVVVLDFIHPACSNRYNFLQPVLDAVNLGDMEKAVMAAQDIATMLRPEKEDTHTDPIWPMGERAIITVAVLVVCMLFEDPRYQNMANVRHFIAKMCVPGQNGAPAPIIGYLNGLPDGSPMRTALDIAKIAPEKMQCSFYASALTTLSLFADTNIHAMTAYTDFDHLATSSRKRAVFLIVPDERSTYYSLASLFVYQQYQLLVDQARKNGGRLPRRVEFVCDEFGNFSRITDFDKAITVSAGRGIRWHLYLQDFEQLYKLYGKETGRTIISNCETLVYLKTNNDDTLRSITTRLDKYTVKSPSLSASSGGQSSASYSLTGRDLLTVAELRRVWRPYQLVMTSADPVIMYAPDISKTFFNTLFGMGSRRHNQRLQILRDGNRPIHNNPIYYWDGYKTLMK